MIIASRDTKPWIFCPFNVFHTYKKKTEFVLFYIIRFNNKDVFDFRWKFIGVTGVEQILSITLNQLMSIGKHDLNRIKTFCVL